jgi:hypothetical protein
LRPLMHTPLIFSAEQNIVIIQRFGGFSNVLGQTGPTFSSGLTIRVSLHLGHLIGVTFTRLISSGFIG